MQIKHGFISASRDCLSEFDPRRGLCEAPPRREAALRVPPLLPGDLHHQVTRRRGHALEALASHENSARGTAERHVHVVQRHLVELPRRKGGPGDDGAIGRAALQRRKLL